MEEKNNSKKGLIIALVVVIILLLGVCGYLIYDKFLSNNGQNNDIDNKATVETVSITDSKVVSLYDGVKISGNIDLMNDDYYNNNISNSIKTFLVDKKISDTATKCEPIDDYVNCYEYSLNSAKNTWAKLFGKNDTFKYEDFVLCKHVVIENDKIKIYQDACGSEATACELSGFSGLLVNAERLSDSSEYYLYEVISYSDFDATESDKCALYTDSSFKNLVTKYDISIAHYDITSVKDQLSQYKYTFKLEDGNYYLANIEKVK